MFIRKFEFGCGSSIAKKKQAREATGREMLRERIKLVTVGE